MDIHSISKYLVSQNIKLKGCSVSEMKRLERYFELTLPSTYVEFLYYMGKGAGSYMEGSSVFLDEIYILKPDFEELLLERGLSLPANAFVFWAHQGYQFAFFCTDEGDNPPVYFYYEGKNAIEQKENYLTDFFTAQLPMSGFDLM
ncbi:SUKH superfamily protein [Chitinophaga dinghuensis]|uniref:SUKH superfamily protein n=1 Tax=Chitinophaga dinghuensis TaxID=1539050 RepID=A0A327WCI5_9BACT|nr:SMI1/KNR4 family protein [Chitinophaga dinghuensis]RAJ88235.1 SUKH superfamily protein [Chitinophaga dinghuensis]